MSWKIVSLSLDKTCFKKTSQVWRAERAIFRAGSGRLSDEVARGRPAPILGSLKQRRRRRQRERQKGIGLISKAKRLLVHHAFLYIFLPSLHDYNVKVPEWLAAKLAFPCEFVKVVGLTERKKGKTLSGEGTFITNYFINFSLRHKQSGNVPSIVL